MSVINDYILGKLRLDVEKIAIYPNVSDFPVTGRSGLIYIATVTDKVYVWDDTASAYVEIDSVIPVIDNLTSSSATSALSANQGRVLNTTKVTSVSGSNPISSSGGLTPDISIPLANTSTDGYLNSTDWNTFNSKLDNIVEDLTPQLGGNLDMQSFNLSNQGSGHDGFTDYNPNEHFLQSDILQVNPVIGSGLVTSLSGILSTTTDNTSDWDTAYTHSQDNTQAHSDYLINNGNDSTSGHLTTAGFTSNGSSFNVNDAVFFFEASNATMFFRRTDNTLSAPSFWGVKDRADGLPVQNGTGIMFFGGRGDDGAGLTGATAFVGFRATETWSSTAHGTNMTLEVTPNGSVSRRTGIQVENDGTITMAYLGTLSGKSDVQYDTSTGELGYVSSSERYKKDIVDFENTDFLHDLNCREFVQIKDETKQNGLIAEEVEKINPNLVSYKIYKIENNELKEIDRNYKNISEYHKIKTNVSTIATLKYDVEKDDNVAEEKTETFTIVKVPETVNYTQLITPMLKLLQEQEKRILALEA